MCDTLTPFFDEYCSTVQGLLDWFEVDLAECMCDTLTPYTHHANVGCENMYMLPCVCVCVCSEGCQFLKGVRGTNMLLCMQEGTCNSMCDACVSLTVQKGRFHSYGVPTINRLLKIIGLFCKRAPKKRRYSAKESYNSKEPTDGSHPIERRAYVYMLN